MGSKKDKNWGGVKATQQILKTCGKPEKEGKKDIRRHRRHQVANYLSPSDSHGIVKVRELMK